MIENNQTTLSEAEIDSILMLINNDRFVGNTFKGIYFSDEDNQFIDNVRAHLKEITNPYKRAIPMTALMRACLKKIPRGIFTYTGGRYNDGRQDLKKTLEQQFL